MEAFITGGWIWELLDLARIMWVDDACEGVRGPRNWGWKCVWGWEGTKGLRERVAVNWIFWLLYWQRSSLAWNSSNLGGFGANVVNGVC